MQWVDNFNVGDEPYHKAFNDRAVKVIDSLIEYINNNYANKKIKVLVTGYSRGGGVANVVGQKLASDYNIVDIDDIYTYTFEAPRGLDTSISEYPMIFNLVNNADIVTQILPESYGNKRAGIDINTYDSDIDNYIQIFDSALTIPSFNSNSSNYTNEVERAEYIINTLTKKLDNGSKTLSTKEEFYNNYQSSIMFFVELGLSIKNTTLQSLMSVFQNEVNSLFKLYALKENDKIYEMVKPIIDRDGWVYEDSKLKDACNDLKELIFGPANALVSSVLAQYLASKSFDSVLRLGFNHDSLCNYVLINNYIYK